LGRREELGRVGNHLPGLQTVGSLLL
jgi:hypothetical protein